MFSTIMRPLFLSLALTVSLVLPATGASPTKPSSEKAAAVHVEAHGTLHVVAVGISYHEEKRFIVTGGEENTKAIAKTFLAQEGRLYEDVIPHRLTGKAATADAILEELARLRTNVRPGDSVVVYLNGHGKEIGGQWRMAAADFDPDTLEGSVTASDLRARLKKLPCPVLLLLDSCHAGAFGEGVSNRTRTGEAGLVVYAGCQADEYGWNVPEMRRSLFSLALVEALSGKADANGDGVVTLAEVDAYVAVRLPQLQRKLIDPEVVREVLREVGGKEEQTPRCSRPSTVAADTPLAGVGTPAK